jgi:hypothetical protein
MGVKESCFFRQVTSPLQASFPHLVNGTMSHSLNKFLLSADHVLDTAENKTEEASTLRSLHSVLIFNTTIYRCMHGPKSSKCTLRICAFHCMYILHEKLKKNSK